MTSIKVETITADTTASTNSSPTIVEKLLSLRHSRVDDSINPGERDWYKNPMGVVFVKNFRGFKTGERGRRTEGTGQDALYIEIPTIIPLDQIAELVKHLTELEKLARKEIADLG